MDSPEITPSAAPPDQGGWQLLVERVAGQEMVRVRAGRGDHAPLPIWMVVADGRVFVRSWQATGPQGWAATMRREGRGSVFAGRHEVPVAATPVTDGSTQALVSAAYRDKYGRFREVEDMVREPSISTTLELTPIDPQETSHA